MTWKLIGTVALGAAAIGMLTTTAVPALGHGPGADEPGANATTACPVAGEGMGSMMGMPGPDDEDGAADPVDHRAHHPAEIPEPTE